MLECIFVKYGCRNRSYIELTAIAATVTQVCDASSQSRKTGQKTHGFTLAYASLACNLRCLVVWPAGIDRATLEVHVSVHGTQVHSLCLWREYKNTTQAPDELQHRHNIVSTQTTPLKLQATTDVRRKWCLSFAIHGAFTCLIPESNALQSEDNCLSYAHLQ